MTTGIPSLRCFMIFTTRYEAVADGMHEIEFFILFLYKKIDVAKIVKSAVYSRKFPAIESDIRPCECCECLDPSLQTVV